VNLTLHPSTRAYRSAHAISLCVHAHADHRVILKWKFGQSAKLISWNGRSFTTHGCDIGIAYYTMVQPPYFSIFISELDLNSWIPMIFRYQSPSPWRWLGPSCLCQFSLSNWCLKSWGKGRNQKPSLESSPHGSLQNVIVWEIFWVRLKNTPFIGATAIFSVAHYHTIPLLVAYVCLTIIYFYFLLGIPMFSGHNPQISHFFDGFISMFLPTYTYIYTDTWRANV